MQRSSETIGAIAGALAKAQAELNNPQKSMTATIPALFPREAEKTFRYAPLSAGLDLVRKCLSQQEIAVVQTTAVDKEAGFVQLTTVLAHSSGEWMSSDWPVCPVSETAAPHRMGAALTYARRYALFTLVRIAGEDDLDAPDLPRLEFKGEVGIAPRSAASGRSGNGHPPAATPTVIATSRPLRKSSIPLAKPILDADASATLRDQLLGEIAALGSNEQIDDWALRGDGRWLILDNRHLALNEAAGLPHFTPLFAINHQGVKLFAAPYAAAAPAASHGLLISEAGAGTSGWNVAPLLL